MKTLLNLRPLDAAFVALGFFLLPFLMLIPIGYLWLFERGWLWLLGWAVVAAIASGAALLVWRRVAKRYAIASATKPLPPEPTWSPHDEVVWTQVVELTNRVDAAEGLTPDHLGRHAIAIIETVAGHYRAADKRAVWAFSVPEALLLTERISHDLRWLVAENVPFGDRITIGMAFEVYGWLPMLKKGHEIYERSSGLWRLVRPLLSIGSAGANEARLFLSRELVGSFVSHTKTKLVRLLLQEIGRAAIDLYSGRLRLSDQEIALYRSKAAERDASRPPLPAEPLRILLAGQINAGKSSLVNALTGGIEAAVDVLPTAGGFTGHRISLDGVPAAIIIDSPGLGAGSDRLDRLIEEASASDLILWTVAGNRPAREIDRAALERLRSTFAADPRRRRPPIMLVLTQIDRLRPYTEWDPPYDLADPAANGKAASIRDALAAACEELAIDHGDAVPVCLAETTPPYNLEALWERLQALTPEARKAQLNRVLAEAKSDSSWSRVLSQAIGTGRVVIKAHRI